jgi:transcriptional regulator with XRE-family HTH domain
MFLDELRNQVRRYRASHGLKQEEFGKLVGLSQSALAAFEIGKSCPRGEELDRVVDLVRSPEVVFADELQSVVDYLRLPGVDANAKITHLISRLRAIEATLEISRIGGREIGKRNQ